MVRDEILGLKILWGLVVIGMIIMALQWVYNQLTALPEVTWWILALIVLLILSGLLERHYQRTHNN